MFMYVEDDVLVRWNTVLAWAADDALLAPLGFQRGFFRTEFSTEKGAGSQCPWQGWQETDRASLPS